VVLVVVRAAVIAMLTLWVSAPSAVLAQEVADEGAPALMEVSSKHRHQPASIWFHPLPSASDWPGRPAGSGGSTDFLALFQANAPWPRAIAHVSVIGMYAGWILEASDQALQQTVAFMNAHNMTVEIEAPALQATATCGSGVEGYVPYGLSIGDVTLQYLQRLKALGAQVAFVKVDEPFFFGSVVDDSRSCHSTVSEIASQVGAYAQLVRSIYPKAAVGDVEPIIASAYPQGVTTAIAQWHATYRKVTGMRFPFFFADIDFSNPLWPSIVKTLEDETRQSRMRFGIIYIGDQDDSSDAEWAGKAVARFESYQVQNGGRPDYVLFQSWQPHPMFCLPESDPTTFTGVLDAYIAATTM
jgi:hypothetical protein